MHLIEVRDVYKIYNPGENQVNALDGVSITIDEGEFVAIIGQSGSGKSTLMNMLGLLDTPTHGEYYINGKLVDDLTDDQMSVIRNEEIGFIFQGFNLISSLSALENVELPLVYRGMPKQERREISQQALERVGLGSRIHHLPAEMSGGQQQRVAVASTYAGKLPSRIGDYTVVYDDNNRCTQVKKNSYVYGEIDYDKGVVIMDDEEAKVSFNSDGYVTGISASWNYNEDGYSYKGSGKISFSYNGNGQLVSYIESSSESGKEDGESFSSQGSYKATYTWKDGNLIKVVTKEESTEDGEKYEYGSTCTIEYGEEKNELGQYTLGQAKVLDMEDADVFALVGMLGKASAYFPVSYTEEYYEKDSEQNYENEYSENMTYVLNTDKTIKTEYINGSPYSYSYVAIDNDSDNLKVRSLLPSDKKNLNLRSFFIRHHGRK